MAREKKDPEWQDPVSLSFCPETLAEHYARCKMLISLLSTPHILPHCSCPFLPTFLHPQPQTFSSLSSPLKLVLALSLSGLHYF